MTSEKILLDCHSDPRLVEEKNLDAQFETKTRFFVVAASRHSSEWASLGDSSEGSIYRNVLFTVRLKGIAEMYRLSENERING